MVAKMTAIYKTVLTLDDIGSALMGGRNQPLMAVTLNAHNDIIGSTKLEIALPSPPLRGVMNTRFAEHFGHSDGTIELYRIRTSSSPPIAEAFRNSITSQSIRRNSIPRKC